MMFARVNGDLRKAQCLLALGARVPDESEYSEVTVEESRRNKVQIVDGFLKSMDKAIPKTILDICSLDKSGPVYPR